MEKPEKENKKKSPRISRLGEVKKVSLREHLDLIGKTLLSLMQERFFLLFLLCLFIVLVNAPSLFIPTRTYKLGETVDFDLKATRNVLMEDTDATEAKKQHVITSALSVYDFFENTGLELQKKIHLGFQTLRDRLKKQNPGDVGKGDEAHLFLKKSWEIDLTPLEFEILLKDRFSESFEGSLVQMIQSVLTTGVVNSKLDLMNEQGKGIRIRKLPSKQEMQVREIDRFHDLEEARDRLEKKAAYFLTGKKRALRSPAIGLAQKLIVPNLFFNKAETENRINKALQEVRPVLFEVKKGDVLVREGERITPVHLAKIKMATRIKSGTEVLGTSLGLALIWGLFIFMVYLAAKKGGLFLSEKLRDLIFLTSLLAASFLSIQTSYHLAQILVGGFPRINPQSVLLTIPIAAGPMMTSLVLGPVTALLFGLVQSFLAFLIWEGNPELALYFAISGLWASMTRGTCHTRWDLIRMGFFLGLINLAGVFGLQLMHGRLFSLETPINLFFGFLGGILAGIVVTGFSPLIEKIFGYTTDLKLLERANMDQPLLRELMVQAPGTYHHSIIVGNMVEAAAEAIGANALLARVSAYYHDIGKIQKPLYFIENQIGIDNRHDKLAPSLSSLILVGHIKDGVEMAYLNKLEAPIIDIISQHHGTNLISYFYQKALDLKGGDVNQVSMEDFRYPGPKPQTREAGLVLLADAIEAASRTLVDPTPARIQGLVQKIIHNAFSDGQLDECDLTLKDLSLIAAGFNKILNGIFHHRIQYPESNVKGGSSKRKQNGDSDKQQSETDRPARDPENQPSTPKGLAYP